MKRKLVSVILSLAMVLALIPAVGVTALAANSRPSQSVVEQTQDWAIYIYMCGSDLEGSWSCSTNDILEMLDADLPDDVKIVLFTGGAHAWDPLGVSEGVEGYISPDPTSTQIFLLDDDKMTLIWDYHEYLDMGSADTAKTFVQDVMTLVPAEHKMITFWNHGGALSGAEMDENTGKIIKVTGLVEIMQAAQTANSGKKIDLVGFDACLMSTFEVAALFSPYADYLVASEEVEPGSGWYYEFLNLFTTDEDVTAVELGTEIVSKYSMSLTGTADDWSTNTEGTLALIDLSKMDTVKDALNNFGNQAVAILNKELPQGDTTTYARLARAGESAQSVSAGYGMVDLYDFMYKVKKTVPDLADAAQGVMNAVGIPYGASVSGYNGHVAPQYYVGPSEGGAVVYRGVGLPYDNCAGLTIYYPLIDSMLSPEDVVDFYERMGLGDGYGKIISAQGTYDLPIFSGSLKTGYDDGGVFFASADPAEQLNGLKLMEYVTTYTEMNPSSLDMMTYLLGNQVLPEGWDDNKFSVTPHENWFALGGKLVTLKTLRYQFVAAIYGSDYYEYGLNCVLTDTQGKQYFSTLYLASNTDPSTAQAGSTVTLEVEGAIVTTEEVQGEQGEDQQMVQTVSRVLLPDNIAAIEPMLSVVDPNTLNTFAYTPTGARVELNEDATLTFTVEPLISNGTTYYESFFKGTDLWDIPHLSEPFTYFIISSIDELNVAAIPAQAYTGSPVTPAVELLYQGAPAFTEGVDYTVDYTNNVEKGTATAVITSLMEEVPGTLTADFTICDAKDVASETMKLLPDHDVISGCENGGVPYEYVQHIQLLEQVKKYYEAGAELSAEELAVLQTQYSMVENRLHYELTSGGLTLLNPFTAFRATDGAKLQITEETPDSFSGKVIASYHVEVVDSNGQPLLLFPNQTITLKIPIDSSVNTSGLAIYSIPANGDTPVKADYTVVERGGQAFILVDLPDLGYIVLEKSSAGDPGPGSAGDPGGGSSDSSTYPPTVSKVEHGKVSVSPNNPKRGDTVTITPTPDDGYEVGDAVVKDRSGNKLEVKNNGDGTFTFIQPTGKVTVEVTFVLTTCDGGPDCPGYSFVDLNPHAWYHEAVDYVIRNGLMNGYGDGTFGPDNTLSRATLAQILYNLEGGVPVNYLLQYDDVPADAWYTEAVRWATSEGIVSGYGNGVFGPNDLITREQLAAMLYRYARSKDDSLGQETFRLDFTDAADVSGWAYEAMRWCNVNGIVEGKGNGILDPKGNATRAQVAAMLMRFCENDT